MAIGSILAIGISEIVLRVIPSTINQWGTNIRYVEDQHIGYKLAPNQNGQHNMPCFESSPVTTNSLGFRDGEWVKDEKPKIALLGDSFIEALMVKDGEHFADILEKMTGMQVINAALSGQGTVAQLETYSQFVAKYTPDIVILFFYAGNDLYNNDCGLNEATGNGFVAPCPCATYDGERPIFTLPESKGIANDGFFSICKTCAAVKHIFSGDEPVVPQSRWDQYYFPYTPQLKRTLLATSTATSKLAFDVESTGGKFFIVTIPPYLQFLQDPASEIARLSNLEDVRRDIKVRLPSNYMLDFASDRGMFYLDLYDELVKYANRNEMPEPWFYYTCNGHFNPLGHFVMTNLVLKTLHEKQLMNLNSALESMVEKNLSLSPKEILGEEGYNQIYSGQVFEGNTNITQLIGGDQK